MRVAIRQCPKTLNDLLDELICSAVSSTKSGRFLIKSAANGHNAEWQIPTDWTPLDSAEMLEDIIRRKEEAATYLGDSPTDDALIEEILRCLTDSDDAPINDYRSLRDEGICR